MSVNENHLQDLVCEALLMADEIRRAVIEIEYEEGTITLKGTVQSEADRLVAEALARQQEGIVEVINKLHMLDR